MATEKYMPAQEEFPDSAMKKPEYVSELIILQKRIASAVDNLAGDSWLFIFEGRDTAGKTGTIKKSRMFADHSRALKEHMPSPSYPEEKKARRDISYYKDMMPGPGRVLFMDRSYYGNVLGLRVNSPNALNWPKAFDEINAFEQELAGDGTRIAKFWLEISRPEMRKRIMHRKTTPALHYKYSYNDEKSMWQYDKYTKISTECFESTGTPRAPWYVVDMNDKWRGRLRIMEMIANMLEGEPSEVDQ